jgi:rhamnosyl/mannosyltransferase
MVQQISWRILQGVQGMTHNSESKTLRVLQAYRTYFPDPPGGLQEVIRQVALSSAEFGVVTRIFTLSPEPHPKFIRRPEGEVVRERSWAAPGSCDLGGAAAVREFARSCATSDVLHLHFPWPYADVLHAVARPAIPAIVTYHSDIIRQKIMGKVYAPLMWRTLQAMNFIVATSPTYANTSPILSDRRVRDKVRVIPSGIVEDSYPKQADVGIFDRINVSPDEPFFLFIGVLRYYKGLHTLIRAAVKVNAKIVIAGTGPEQQSLGELREQLSANNVIFAGQISDEEKVALLQSCLAMVLPSHLRSEAFGMVLVEAAMFGKPQISCEIGTGTSYVNLHEETGIVISPENPGKLTGAMNTLLNEHTTATQLGANARRRYESLFSGPALGKAYSDLYREVADSCEG